VTAPRSAADSQDIIVGFLRANPGSPISAIFAGTVLNDSAIRKNVKILADLGILRRKDGHRREEDLWWVASTVAAPEATAQKEE
jgi:predicted transcriptional regulator